jgi:hypothetical protein
MNKDIPCCSHCGMPRLDGAQIGYIDKALYNFLRDQEILLNKMKRSSKELKQMYEQVNAIATFEQNVKTTKYLLGEDFNE